jgi:hypothetical protein
MNKIDFIGLGAQKSATSWAYTCLYEHPQVCMPIKEIHFFSRPRYAEGREWYESHFSKCDSKKLKGEWSTSYLYSPEAPGRIRAWYPEAKLLAILRNPVTRAYSQFRNAIRAGEIPKDKSFEAYSAEEKSVWDQGLYAQQLERYYALFPKNQILVLIQEDIDRNPVAFMKQIHEFLGIEKDFVSSMVHTPVNVGRTPAVVGIDRILHHIAEFLRAYGFDRLVHAVKKSGIPGAIRAINTSEGQRKPEKNEFDPEYGKNYLRSDVRKLSQMLGRDLEAEWGFKN